MSKAHILFLKILTDEEIKIKSGSCIKKKKKKIKNKKTQDRVMSPT